MEAPIELPDPSGDGVLIGHPTTDGTVWTLCRDDGTVEPLGTAEHYHQAVKLRLAAIDARRQQINARRDELVTTYPALKAVGRNAA